MSDNDVTFPKDASRMIVSRIKRHPVFRHRDVDVFLSFDDDNLLVESKHVSVADLRIIEEQIRLFNHDLSKSSSLQEHEPAPSSAPCDIEVAPSRYLYELGSLLDKSTRDMVFKPLIDDFHHEYFEALAHGRPTRRLVWVYRCHATVALIGAIWLRFRKQLAPGGS